MRSYQGWSGLSWRGGVGALTASALSVAALSVTDTTAWAAKLRPGGTSTSGPAYNGDFPDPSVLATPAGYYAYSTGSAGRNVQVMSSSDLVHWSTPAEALPNLPSWASFGLTWAPSVWDFGGTYVMWYTVHASASGRQCISVATSASAAGPFTDPTSGPALCQANGSIDPNIFVDNGTPYLLWKSDDNSVGLPSRVWVAPLNGSGTALSISTYTLLLTENPSGWQAPAMEGPTMLNHNGRYYLFYGAGDWATRQAGIGYATCSAPLGPCVDQSSASPWYTSHGSALGPSGPNAFVDRSGSLHLAYHAWFGCVGYASGCYRALYLGSVTFTTTGRPSLG